MNCPWLYEGVTILNFMSSSFDEKFEVFSVGSGDATAFHHDGKLPVILIIRSLLRRDKARPKRHAVLAAASSQGKRQTPRRPARYGQGAADGLALMMDLSGNTCLWKPGWRSKLDF